ncbi:MAG: crossover junction endodeoxyribonuclease RuvC [Isosphaeraceae bacterium]|nr:crossover junction endodeoxyribonuclease RuvC [Isosphaeraceae bacterium]
MVGTPGFESVAVGAADGRPIDRVLGIDPGLGVTGYAVVGGSLRGPVVIEAGVLRPERSEDDPMASRLRSLHVGVLELIDTFRPASLALEQVHSHVRHPRTSILMAHARGVIVLAAALRDVPVFGYAAARIKKSLTGSGKAPKDQMQRAVQIELRLAELPEPHDVADACAVALCHYQIDRNRRGLVG